MATVKTDLLARDIMTADPVCVSPATRIRELARIFEQHDISGAPVVDQEGKVIGIVSKTDLIRRCSEGTDEIPPAYLFETLAEQGEEEASEVIPEPLICVEDFMTEDPLTVDPSLPAAEVAKLMYENRLHRVVVADAGKVPQGIITSLDLMGVFSRMP